MSSVAHARVRTINKECLLKAAKDLGVSVKEEKNTVSVGATSFKFDSKGNVEVKYWDDVKSAAKTAKNLAQLSTYYTMRDRLEKSGMKVRKSVKDAVLAVRANQALTLEMEEETTAEKVAVK